MDRAIQLDSAGLNIGVDARPLGTRVLAALIAIAQTAVRELPRASGGAPLALLSRLRGTGRGVSSSALFDALERDHPLELVAPFEGSPLVSGAVWNARDILGPGHDAAVAQLRWEAGARDLPMHVHDHSERFIIVRSGRGFFHVSDEPCERFTGQSVRSIPARERDVFLFTRGVVHTFSTDREPMVLYSCQLPYLPFDHPEQYRLPKVRWTAADHPEDDSPTVACDPAWSVLARQEPRPWWEGKNVPPLV